MQLSTRIAIAVAMSVPLVLVAVVSFPTPKMPATMPAPKQVVELATFLPRGVYTDGSVDYTARVQLALDNAANRTLVLPPFPVLVAPAAGRNWCLKVSDGTTIVGGPQAVLRTNTPAVQLLRIENAQGVRLEGFGVEGVGGIGRALGHGLVQLWRCKDVVLRDLRVFDADADGLAIAESENVRVTGCLVERASKAGIYLSNCTAAVVSGNVVRDTVGHVAPDGLLVGTGILLLSNADVTCNDNTIAVGVGPGILCGSNEQQRATDGVAIVGNRIRDCVNPTNGATSSGIQLANVQFERRTHVLVASNSIRGCGQHGILVDNHDGATISGNSIEDAWMSAIVIGHARAVHVVGNTILDANVAHANGQAGVYLHAHATGCVVSGNLVTALTQPALTPVLDKAVAGANSVQ